MNVQHKAKMGHDLKFKMAAMPICSKNHSNDFYPRSTRPIDFFFFFYCRLLLPFRHHIFSHIMYFIYFFVFYTICLSLGCSDDVDMTDHPPPHTTSAAPETKQCWRRWRSHIPLSPVEQPRLPLLFFFFFNLFFFLIYCID